MPTNVACCHYMTQWHAVTSEAGHAVGMPKLVMQLTYNTLWVGQKLVWDSKTKTNFFPKIMVFSTKKIGLHLKSISDILIFCPKTVVFFIN